MKRYALPLGILLVTVGLFAAVAFSTTGLPDYSAGEATTQPISAEWVRGNAASPVLFIEYSDFQCPACRAYQPLLSEAHKVYGDRVAFVFRHYPLLQIHPNADLAARAAEAAGMQGKFWEMHDVLFEKQSAWSRAVNTASVFETYAKSLGLDMAKFKQDIESDAVKKAVADDYARGNEIGVQGTPTFVLGGVRVAKNPTTMEEFAQILQPFLGGR